MVFQSNVVAVFNHLHVIHVSSHKEPKKSFRPLRTLWVYPRNEVTIRFGRSNSSYRNVDPCVNLSVTISISGWSYGSARHGREATENDVTTLLFGVNFVLVPIDALRLTVGLFSKQTIFSTRWTRLRSLFGYQRMSYTGYDITVR
jgi:hypothetical protein